MEKAFEFLCRSCNSHDIERILLQICALQENKMQSPQRHLYCCDVPFSANPINIQIFFMHINRDQGNLRRKIVTMERLRQPRADLPHTYKRVLPGLSSLCKEIASSGIPDLRTGRFRYFHMEKRAELPIQTFLSGGKLSGFPRIFLDFFFLRDTMKDGHKRMIQRISEQREEVSCWN